MSAFMKMRGSAAEPTSGRTHARTLFGTRVLLTLLGLLGQSCGVENDNPLDRLPRVTLIDEGSGDTYDADLFPLDQGTSWTYVIPGQRTPEYLVQSVAGFQRMFDDTVTIVNRTDSMVTRPTFLAMDAEGLWDHGSLPLFYGTPIPRLLFPIRVGKRWSMTDSTTGLEMTAAVGEMEQVQTPAGVFSALRIEYSIRYVDDGVGPILDTWWLTPGVGLVKRIGAEVSRDENLEFKYLHEPPAWVLQEYNWLLRSYTDSSVEQ